MPLTVVEPAPLLGWDRNGIDVELPRLGRTQVGLRGRHQAANVAVADAVLDALEVAGIVTTPPAARRAGYGRAVWPGRLELVRAGGRDVLLDGAHNPAGAAALAEAVGDLRPFLEAGRVTLVLGAMADKDVDGIIAALAREPSLATARVLATAVDAPRALPAADARRALACPACRMGRWRRSPRQRRRSSGRWATRAVGPPGPIVVAGSLYLVGEVRARLVDDPALARRMMGP